MTNENEDENEEEIERAERFVPYRRVSDSIIESVVFEGSPRFLRYDGEKFDVCEYEDVWIGEESVRLRPLPEGKYPYRPYRFDEELINKINTRKIKSKELFKRIYEQFDVFLDLDSKYKTLEAVSTNETYVQHKLNSISYLYHQGDNESGKTVALDVHSLLDYRPLKASTLPVADVYRYLGEYEEGQCTIIEDEAQNIHKEKEKMKIYKEGYKKGGVAPRIGENNEQRFFKVYSCKFFAGVHLPDSKGFNQRCIQIPMFEGIPEKDEITAEDKEKMDQLKSYLLAWRLKNFYDDLPDLEVSQRARLKELWKPHLQTSHGLGIAKGVMEDLATEAQRKKRRRLIGSINHYIVKTVSQKALDYLKDAGEVAEVKVPFSDVWNSLYDELDAEEVKGKPYKMRPSVIDRDISKQLVGRRLGSVLGGESTVTRKGSGSSHRVWKFEVEKILRLAKKYYLSDEVVEKLEGFSKPHQKEYPWEGER